MLAAFKLLPIGLQIGLAAGAFVLVTGAATGVYFHIYNSGWNDAIAGVASRNSVAINAVRKSVSRVDDCSANGGFWDTVNGVCN